MCWAAGRQRLSHVHAVAFCAHGRGTDGLNTGITAHQQACAYSAGQRGQLETVDCCPAALTQPWQLHARKQTFCQQGRQASRIEPAAERGTVLAGLRCPGTKCTSAVAWHVDDSSGACKHSTARMPAMHSAPAVHWRHAYRQDWWGAARTRLHSSCRLKTPAHGRKWGMGRQQCWRCRSPGRTAMQQAFTGWHARRATPRRVACKQPPRQQRRTTSLEQNRQHPRLTQCTVHAAGTHAALWHAQPPHPSSHAREHVAARATTADTPLPAGPLPHPPIPPPPSRRPRCTSCLNIRPHQPWQCQGRADVHRPDVSDKQQPTACSRPCSLTAQASRPQLTCCIQPRDATAGGAA